MPSPRDANAVAIRKATPETARGDLHPLESYPGGKGSPGAWHTIINQIPPTSLYAELFLGHGSVLRNLRPAVAGLAVDGDAAVIAAWQGHQIPGLRVVRGDALTVLRSYPWPADAVIYLDPPYPFSVRLSSRPLYACEFGTDAQHAELLGIIRELPCRVLISSYWSALYADALHDWRTITYQSTDRGGNVREEWLWLNYPEPFELHDARYLGDGFRDRHRIRKKVRRWRDRLQRMPLEDRAAVLAALDELRGAGVVSSHTGNGAGAGSYVTGIEFSNQRANCGEQRRC